MKVKKFVKAVCIISGFELYLENEHGYCTGRDLICVCQSQDDIPYKYYDFKVSQYCDYGSKKYLYIRK